MVNRDTVTDAVFFVLFGFAGLHELGEGHLLLAGLSGLLMVWCLVELMIDMEKKDNEEELRK